MKKLHSFALYALATPVLTLGASSVLAQQSAGQDSYGQEQSTQREQGATQATPRASQSDQSTQRAGQSGSQTAADRMNMGDQSRIQNRGYMASAPANGMQSSHLIGAEVRTLGGEEVGPVEDLIVNEDGQIVAVIVSVGGFLGIGQRDVAIGWDDITKSGLSDELELQIDVTRESLGAAPEFETRD